MNQVMVRLDDMELVGRVVDAAVGAGANRVTGISFELSDPRTAYHEALRLAVARARAEAEVLADALGEPLGAVMQVSTGGPSCPAGDGHGGHAHGGHGRGGDARPAG
jgi:uncharacterized protein